MKARPIHSRDDLIAVVRDHAPTRACERAIGEGRTEVLGGFTPVEGFPFLLLRVTSRFGKAWLLGLQFKESHNTMKPIWPETVPWADWDGRVGGRSLKDGDDPKRYARYRARARREHGTAETTKAG